MAVNIDRVPFAARMGRAGKAAGNPRALRQAGERHLLVPPSRKRRRLRAAEPNDLPAILAPFFSV
jgi:hypothetical protein